MNAPLKCFLAGALCAPLLALLLLVLSFSADTENPAASLVILGLLTIGPLIFGTIGLLLSPLFTRATPRDDDTPDP